MRYSNRLIIMVTLFIAVIAAGCIPRATMEFTGKVKDLSTGRGVSLILISMIITNSTNTVLTGLDGGFAFKDYYYSNVAFLITGGGRYMATNFQMDVEYVRFHAEVDFDIDLNLKEQ
ncbi:MAG: hypothetical protein HPY53_05645 [Brevinematales bacterium]|nr:hypothetical protein [Brevinematales bacterium]